MSNAERVSNNPDALDRMNASMRSEIVPGSSSEFVFGQQDQTDQQVPEDNDVSAVSYDPADYSYVRSFDPVSGEVRLVNGKAMPLARFQGAIAMGVVFG